MSRDASKRRMLRVTVNDDMYKMPLDSTRATGGLSAGPKLGCKRPWCVALARAGEYRGGGGRWIPVGPVCT